jgi:integrase
MRTDLETALGEYLAQRRSRGYKLTDEGTLLAAFVEALHEQGRIERVTVVDAVAFAQRDLAVSRATHAWRLGVIRRFSAWLRTTDPDAAEVIPAGMIRGNYQRVTPYLYSPGQVEQLMAAAQDLPRRWLADAMYILIGLLYVTGLRSGEAFRLDVEDFDSFSLVLHVSGKLDRRRLVPVHPSTAEQLSGYCADRTSGPLLVGPAGKRLAPTTAQSTFRRLVETCDLTPQPGARHARLHDLRHTLAVDALVDAHRHGLDVDARIAVLSTFLGHKEPANTYWYLTATPELMSAVSDRMAAALGRRPR